MNNNLNSNNLTFGEASSGDVATESNMNSATYDMNSNLNFFGLSSGLTYTNLYNDSDNPYNLM